MAEKRKCAALTKAGKPCQATALPNSLACFNKSHQEQVEGIIEVDVPSDDGLCGHLNEHSSVYLTKDDYLKGVTSKLTCTLPEGHEGVHRADYYEIEFARRSEKEVIREEMVSGAWCDMAGTPADQIKPDLKSLEKIQLLRKLRLEQVFSADEIDF